MVLFVFYVAMDNLYHLSKQGLSCGKVKQGKRKNNINY
jgi:hypothetical protein